MLTFTAASASEVSVKIFEGDLYLQGGDFSGFEAQLDSGDDIDYGDLGFRQGDGRVALEVKAAADVELKVPHGARVTVSTGDGHIEVDSFDGALEAHTDDGHIQVRGRFDSLKLSTGDGDIEAEADSGSRASEAWSLRTDDGSIALRLPSDFAADLDATTGDGRVTVDFPLTAADAQKRSVTGKLNGGGLPLTMHTDDGSIEIASS